MAATRSQLGVATTLPGTSSDQPVAKRRPELVAPPSACPAVDRIRSSRFELLLRWTTIQLMRLLWLGKVRGLEHVPASGPCIVVANHASYLDFLVLSAVFELRLGHVLRFWANRRITRHWLFRHYCGPAGCLELSPSAMRYTWSESVRCLSKGRDFLCIFPEGTRTRTGELLNFKLGYLRLAAESQAPVLPVRLVNTYECWPPHHCLPRIRRVDVEFHAPVHVPDHASSAQLREINGALRSRFDRVG